MCDLMMYNSNIRCEKCGRRSTVDFGHAIREGWPLCHGVTMKLQLTLADIDDEVSKLVKK